MHAFFAQCGVVVHMAGGDFSAFYEEHFYAKQDKSSQNENYSEKYGGHKP